MAIQIQCISVWMSLRKLFLTAQVVNLRSPLQVPIFEEESIPNKCWSSLRFRCQRILCIIFGFRGFVLTSPGLVWKTWPLTQFHDCTLHWPVYTLHWQILHLSAPPLNHLFVISQILGDMWPDPTRVSWQVGERTWEQGCVCVCVCTDFLIILHRHTVVTTRHSYFMQVTVCSKQDQFKL